MKLTIISALVLMILSSTSLKAQDVIADSKQNGKTFSFSSADKGAGFIVAVEDQSASTGYVWSFTNSNPSILTPNGTTNEEAVASEPDETGVPSTLKFKFLVSGAAGTTKITLELRRPGDTSSPAARTLSFTVTCSE